MRARRPHCIPPRALHLPADGGCNQLGFKTCRRKKEEEEEEEEEEGGSSEGSGEDDEGSGGSDEGSDDDSGDFRVRQRMRE